MNMTSDILLRILNDNAREDAEDITLDSPLKNIIELETLTEVLDFECGVTPPTGMMEDWTGGDLLKFYTE